MKGRLPGGDRAAVRAGLTLCVMVAVLGLGSAILLDSASPQGHLQAPLPDLPSVDRVVVRVRGRADRTIRHPAEVARLRAFVDAHRTRWREGGSTPPAPHAALHFYREDRLIATFGAGSGVFIARRRGGLMLRRASDDDVRAFSALVGDLPGSP